MALTVLQAVIPSGPRRATFHSGTRLQGMIPAPDEEVFQVAMDVRGGSAVGELSLCYASKMLSGVRAMQQRS